MRGHDLSLRTAENYRVFATEAHGRSPRYEELSLAVAEDTWLLAFLAGLPTAKRQPNLLFAAARYLLGEPPDLAALHSLVSDRGGDLTATMLARRTQTNEPARCAILLPALAMLPQPLAVVEVGASAGLDLNPLDVTNDDDVRWLRCLIWPGETGRQERLSAAIETARRDPPRVHRGDLLTDLPGVIGQAPRDATVVVYHSAVLGYVHRVDRAAFAETMGRLGVVWLSNESPGLLPGTELEGIDPHGFVLTRNGTEPIAVTDSHGTWVEWLT